MIFSILLIVLLIFVSILISFLVDKDIEDVTAVFIFCLLIGLYLLGILKKPHHSFELTLVAFALIWILYIVRNKRIIPTAKDLKNKLITGHTGYLIYLLTVAVLFILYSNHVVNNWDDFHFNATFARDLYEFGGMPVGVKSATGYKTYKPLMQLFYNWGFQGIGGYKEALMFQLKSFLIYTACLPLFKRIDSVKRVLSKVIIAVMTIILPYVFMYEIVDSLSMDCYMGVTAAYCMITIVFEKKYDWFYYLRIVAGLSALTLTKSSAVMFVALCFALWFFVEVFGKKDARRSLINRIGFFAISLAAVLGFWLSWKVFCDRNGNTTYLNNALSDSLSNGLQFKWYAKDTFFGCFKNLATMSLNLGTLGLSFLAVLIITIILAILVIKNKSVTRSDHWLFFVLFGGFIPYFAVLLYTYMFVFEEWEALSYSSFDRYVGTYALLMLYVMVYILTFSEKTVSVHLTCIATACIVTLNYPVLFRGLIPSNYLPSRTDIVDQRNMAENEVLSSMPGHREAESVILVVPQSQTVYSRGLAYAAIPYVTSELAIDALEVDLNEELTNRLSDGGYSYVYFCGTLDEEYTNNCSIIEDNSGENVKAYGKLYRYNKEKACLERVTDFGQ